tara:strand:+ start:430 stop:888 length:459 start_codon:yes stop_codon:yes gene_type:complete
MTELKDEDVKYLYDQFRGEISFEANLIVQRTGWFITSQAFLFSSLVLGIPKNSSTLYNLGNSIYFPLIPLLACIISLLTFFSIFAAIKHAQLSRDKLDNLSDDCSAASISLLKKLHEVRKRSAWVIWFGALPSIFLPIIFFGAWSLIYIKVL